MKILSTDKQKYLFLYNSALRLLQKKPKTEKQILNYLQKKINPDEKNRIVLINKVISELKELNYINDEEYIKLWVEDRNYFKPRSKKALIYELINKGISRKAIEHFFDNNIINENNLAKKAISQKFKTTKNINIKRMYNFLLRRGFSYPVCKNAIEEYIKKE